MLIFEAVEEFIKARVERNWSPFSPVHCEEIQSLFIDGIEMLSHYLQLFGFLKIPINIRSLVTLNAEFDLKILNIYW